MKMRMAEVKIPQGISSWMNRHIRGREKLIYLLIGLTLGVLIAPWTEQRFDCYVNRLWCSLIYGYSLYPFEPMMPPGYPLILRYSYPPIWLLILLCMFRVWLWLTENKFPVNPTFLWKHGVEVNNIYESYRSFVPQSLPLLDFLLKLPNVIAYVGIGWLLFNLAKDAKNNKVILFLWILNPYVIQIATVWGLNDSLCTFLALGSIYFLWKQKTSISAVLLSFSFETKLWPIFFLVPILIYTYRNQGSRASLKYIITFGVVSCLIFSSFFLFPGGLQFLLNLFFFKSSPDWYGRNLFTGITLLRYLLLFGWKSNLPIFPMIFVPAYVGFNYVFWNGKVNFNSLVACLASILLLTYLSYTVVNPQYVFWILPFLLYVVTQGGYSKKLYIVLSLIPLIWTLGINNPLYFISPTIVWEEGNYPPWSDIILRLQSVIFTDFTYTFLILLFTITTLVSLVLLLKGLGKSVSITSGFSRKIVSFRKNLISLVRSRKLFYLLLGLLIRILVAPWTEQRWDSYLYRLWGALLYVYHLAPFEDAVFLSTYMGSKYMPPNDLLMMRYTYPPMWLLIVLLLFPLWLEMTKYTFPGDHTVLWRYGIDSGYIFESFRSFVPPALPLLDLILKLPNILAAIGIGYLLLKLANKKQEKIVLLLWLFNPYTIQMSAVWPHFDSLVAFFALCSAYFLWREKYLISAAFLALGIGTKFYPGLFLIPVLIYLYKKRGAKNALKYFIICALVSGLIFSSFLVFPGGLNYLYKLFIGKSSPERGGNIIAGLTWLCFLTGFKRDATLPFFFPIFPIIFIPAYLVINYVFWRGKNDFDSLVVCLTSILLVVYLSYTLVHENYAVWVLPFMCYLVLRGRFSKRLYMALNIIPLIYTYGHKSPLYFISPAIIWQEWNYPPWSNVINYWWPIVFTDVTLGFLAFTFSFIVIFALVSININIPKKLNLSWPNVYLKSINLRESRKLHEVDRRQSLERNRTHFDQDYHPRRLKRRADLVNINEGSILDAGCGNGAIQRYFPETLEYTGIDFDKDCLTVLWRGRTGANRICGQITQLPFRDNCFNIVLNIEVIEHLPQELQEKFLLELYRTLRKGGKIVLSTPNPETLFHASMWMPPFSPTHFHCVTFSELTKLLNEAGFKLIKRAGDDVIAKYPYKIFKYVPKSFRRFLASRFSKLDKDILIEATKA